MAKTEFVILAVVALIALLGLLFSLGPAKTGKFMQEAGTRGRITYGTAITAYSCQVLGYWPGEGARKGLSNTCRIVWTQHEPCGFISDHIPPGVHECTEKKGGHPYRTDIELPEFVKERLGIVHEEPV